MYPATKSLVVGALTAPVLHAHVVLQDMRRYGMPAILASRPSCGCVPDLAAQSRISHTSHESGFHPGFSPGHMELHPRTPQITHWGVLADVACQFWDSPGTQG